MSSKEGATTTTKMLLLNNRKNKKKNLTGTPLEERPPSTIFVSSIDTTDASLTRNLSMSQVVTPPQTKQKVVSCGGASLVEVPPISTSASSSTTSRSDTPLEPAVSPTKNTQRRSNGTASTAATKKQKSTTKALKNVPSAASEKIRKVSQPSKFTFVMHAKSNVLVAAIAGGNTATLLKPKVKRSNLKHLNDNQLKMIKLEQKYLQIEIQKRRNQRELDRMDREEKEKATLKSAFSSSPLLVSIALAQQQQQYPSAVPTQWY